MPPIKVTFSLNDALCALLDQYIINQWTATEHVPAVKMNLNRPVNTSVFEEAEVVEWLEKE